jgi:ribosome biogenesis SPOUT family RNA methylase Rps3
MRKVIDILHSIWRLLTFARKVPLEEIPYVDYPEILINEHERTEMPFRYVKDAKNEPIMPDVSKAKPLTQMLVFEVGMG